MATIIEIGEDKVQNMSEYAEKVLRYSGKLMQCIDELENKSKYNEYYGKDRRGREPHERNPWEEEKHYNRYY
jgi:hypothetical protein